MIKNELVRALCSPETDSIIAKIGEKLGHRPLGPITYLEIRGLLFALLTARRSCVKAQANSKALQDTAEALYNNAMGKLELMCEALQDTAEELYKNAMWNLELMYEEDDALQRLDTTGIEPTTEWVALPPLTRRQKFVLTIKQWIKRHTG